MIRELPNEKGSLEIKIDHIIDILNTLTDGKPVEDEWPQIGDRYYFIRALGFIDNDIWTDSAFCNACRDFFGVYKTEEEAEAVLVKIKAMLKEI